MTVRPANQPSNPGAPLSSHNSLALLLCLGSILAGTALKPRSGHLLARCGPLGNAAGWNTAKPDKVWNYCAMHHMCDSNEAWKPHCSSCFRCKLGGTEQSNLIVQRSAVQAGETWNAADFYETAKRVPPTQIDHRKVRAESVTILNKFGVDSTNVSPAAVAEPRRVHTERR